MENSNLHLHLQPEVIDSLINSAMILQKIRHHHFTATTKLNFQTKNEKEQAGVVVYRTADSYYSLMKDKFGIVLTRKNLGEKEVIEHIPYTNQKVYFNVEANGLEVNFSFGETPDKLVNIGGTQSMIIISDNKINKFNGPGIGMYATSNGKQSKNKASFDWFIYKEE